MHVHTNYYLKNFSYKYKKKFPTNIKKISWEYKKKFVFSLQSVQMSGNRINFNYKKILKSDFYNNKNKKYLI